MKPHILDEHSTASCFESPKHLTFNIFTVKLCEKCFVQTKTIPIEVNFLSWKKFLVEFNQFEKFLLIFLKKFWWWGKTEKSQIFKGQSSLVRFSLWLPGPRQCCRTTGKYPEQTGCSTLTIAPCCPPELQKRSASCIWGTPWSRTCSESPVEFPPEAETIFLKIFSFFSTKNSRLFSKKWNFLKKMNNL